MLHPLRLALAAVTLTAALPLHAQTFRDASDLLRGAGNSFGPGASAVDVNGDGWVDIYRPNHLFMNHAGAYFENEHARAGLTGEGDAVFGAIFGDYDGDGDLDLLVEDLSPPSFLYRNRGGVLFERANDDTGINTDAVLAQGAVWGDFNADGKLDLFIGSDDGFNLLFENRDGDTFANRTTESIQRPRNSYGVAASDYDQDGDLDIAIGSCSAEADRSIKVFLRNGGAFQFEDVFSGVGVNDDLASWGTVWLDYDNDGWQDLYIVNMPMNDGRVGHNKMYKNAQVGRLFEVDVGVRGQDQEDSFGVSAADFDNDGWIDLYVANQLAPDRLYRNKGDGTFEDAFPGAGISRGSGNGVAVADFNNDGWIDLYLTDFQGGQLLLNEGGTNHWLKVRTRGVEANRFGVGARVEAYTGGQIQVREITAGDGMTSQNHDLSAHFGLSTHTRVDSVVVRWPGGRVDRVTDVDADQDITIVEGLGINQPPTPFRLLGPSNEGAAVASNAQVPFTWEAANDPEDEGISYTLRVQGAEGEIVREGLTEPQFVLDAGVLTSGTTYTWSVTATDGYSVRGSVDRFAFTPTPSTSGEEGEQPRVLLTASSFPNPFEARSTVRVELGRAAHLTIGVFDVQGRRLRTLVDRPAGVGTHTHSWDGRTEQGVAAATGLYFFRVQAGERRRTVPVFKQ